MNEEKTQGIDTETTTKDRHNTNKTTEETELLDLRAGYVQHTSPNFPNTTLILNVLAQMKNKGKSQTFRKNAFMCLYFKL